MVYLFDPHYWNGTIFRVDDFEMSDKDDEGYGWLGYLATNRPIPASWFPQSVTVQEATGELPDMFHTYRKLIVFSGRARAAMEQRAPGQVEFVRVIFDAPPRVAERAKLDSAYYFVNVLGRAQRLQWLEIPTETVALEGVVRARTLPLGVTGVEMQAWKLRGRAVGEPSIWYETPVEIDGLRYVAGSPVFIDDDLWQDLDSEFPGQLNAQRVG